MESDRPLAGEHNRGIVDSRLVLVLVIAWIAAVFSAESPAQITVLAGAAMFFLLRLRALPVFWQRLVWLRWFFLFVVGLHLVLSPGHTLFGLAWLSYDGLLRGLHVSAQVVIALAASIVLVRSATPEQLASAAASLLRPLKVFGIDIERFAEQVLLTLHFVPVLREEAVAVKAQMSASENRLTRFRLYVENLAGTLVTRADRMAHEAVNGEQRSELEPLPPFVPLGLAEWLVAAVSAVIAVVYWCVS